MPLSRYTRRPTYERSWRRARLGSALRSPSAAVQNAANWPALKHWFKCDEGAGSLLTDSASPAGAGSLLPSGGLAITNQAGDGYEWGVAGAFRTRSGASQHVFARRTMSQAIVDMLEGYKSVALEVDFEPAGTAVSRFLNYGRSDNSASASDFRAGLHFEITYNSSTDRRPQFRVFGCEGNTGNLGFTGDVAALTGRRHLVMLWDRTDDANGTLSLYANGGFYGATSMGAITDDAGSGGTDLIGDWTSYAPNLTSQATSAQITVGASVEANDSGGAPAIASNLTIYSMRLWVMNEVPLNFPTAVAQMNASGLLLPAALEQVA